MSGDMVDDLHAAEDLIPEDAIAGYCRPSCGADGDPDPDACGSGGDEDGCGCPCHSRWEAAYGADLGDCPYYRKDGREGAYGPNTCGYGCVDEPSCVTCEPRGGWPSHLRWKFLTDAEFHALVYTGLHTLITAGQMWWAEADRVGMPDVLMAWGMLEDRLLPLGVELEGLDDADAEGAVRIASEYHSIAAAAIGELRRLEARA